MIKLANILTVILISLPMTAQALVYSPDVTIKNIIQWNSNSAVYFTLSNDVVCFVPDDEKNMYSLILSLHATKSKANIHCFDEAETFLGIEGHRVHRIIAY